MDDTRRILQQKIEEKMALGEMNELDPEGFEEQAFDMHSDAYLEGGFAALNEDDMARIALSVEAEDEFMWKSFQESYETAREVEPGKISGVAARIEFMNS